jgi:sucrose-6-phosphate hydrolase SacC (GH32 family)
VVRLASGARVTARMAIAVPYQPVIGDEVLVISQGDEQTYVIGILKGSGLTKWSVPGDLVFEAPYGGIKLECAQPMQFNSERRIDIASPQMTLRATRLEFSARSLVQRVGNAYLWVKELFQVKSRRYRAVADESYLVKTKRVRMKSDGDFNIDGKTIHLG